MSKEHILSEVKAMKPNYCPNCGALLEAEFSAVAIGSTTDKSSGYDCYCPKCEWSGDIYPDAERED